MTIVFSSQQQENKKIHSELSKRISRSMESVESIVRNLQEFSKSKANIVTLRKISSTNDLTSDTFSLKEKHRASNSRLSTSLQSVNEDQLENFRSTRGNNTVVPPDKITEQEIFVKNLDDEWEVYMNQAGRIFYFSKKDRRSSWKPPRRFKPSVRKKLDMSYQAIPFADEVAEDEEVPNTDTLSMVRDSIREDPPVSVPPGYSEFYDPVTGCIYYEDCMTRTRWDTALDNDGHLYFYTSDGSRSEWVLPSVRSSFSRPRGHMRSRSEVM